MLMSVRRKMYGLHFLETFERNDLAVFPNGPLIFGHISFLFLPSFCFILISYTPLTSLQSHSPPRGFSPALGSVLTS